MTETASDIYIPTHLWGTLEGLYKDGEAISDSMTSANIPKRFLAFKVYLVEKTEGVLGGENLEISYPKGGGEIDLKDYVRPGRRTFHLGFDVENEDLADKYKVFYVSGGRKRRIGGEVYGAGCHKYMEISSFFHKAMKGKGLVANTTQQRYVSFLAGTYVIGAHHEGELYLSQLTIKDSRYSELHCSSLSRQVL